MTPHVDILAHLDPDWNRRAAEPPRRRASEQQVPARVHGDYFEIPTERGGWRRFYINGVNLGAALPGKFPAEFPADSATYAGWLELHRGHARQHRPALYHSAADVLSRAPGVEPDPPGRALWLIHGVWTELPPEHDFNDAEWKGEFRQEMRRVADVIHGSADIPARPGHASGLYDADVSRWTLGYIIGREWEPFAVKAFEGRFGSRSASFRGRFLTLDKGLHIDAWMAEQCDYLLGYEMDGYNSIRPIAYTNWPTLDPLFHITESTGAEESAWRGRSAAPRLAQPSNTRMTR